MAIVHLTSRACIGGDIWVM